MKYKDHSILEEAYSKVFEKTLEENTIEENILDRIKGTVSGVAKAAGRIPDASRETTKFTGKGGFFDDVKKGYQSGKSNSIVKSHIEKLEKGLDDFFNDIKTSGNLTPESEANYDQTSRFIKGIIRKIAKSAGTGKVSVSSLKSSLGQAGFLKPEESNEV